MGGVRVGWRCNSRCTWWPDAEGKGLQRHALVRARLDGGILDKVPGAPGGRAAGADRRGQGGGVQLGVLDVTVPVGATVLETREARGG